jgi:hypothetical protein
LTVPAAGIAVIRRLRADRARAGHYAPALLKPAVRALHADILNRNGAVKGLGAIRARSLPRPWLRQHRGGVFRESLPPYFSFLRFVHSARTRGKGLFPALLDAPADWLRIEPKEYFWEALHSTQQCGSKTMCFTIAELFISIVGKGGVYLLVQAVLFCKQVGSH